MRNLILLTIMLAACSPLPAATQTALPTVQVSAATAAPTASPELLFEAATYRDEEAGFELDYPASWFLLGGEVQSRGSYVQIASWDPGPGGVQSIPDGASLLQIAIYEWEPTHDLDARLAMRRNNFTDSGNAILEEQELTLFGARVVRLKLQLTDGSQSLIYLAALGDRYLELSGSGDLVTMDTSMLTLRIDASAQ